MTNTRPEALQRYWNPKGGGVEPHDAGLLYLRDDVDAVIAALAAERDSLRAENERLRLEVAHANDHADAAIEEIEQLRGILQAAVDAWDIHNESGDGMQGRWVSDAREALEGGANG